MDASEFAPKPHVVTCPVCRAKIDLPPDPAAERVRCRECHAMLALRLTKSAAQPAAKPTVAAVGAEAGEYVVGDPVTRPTVSTRFAEAPPLYDSQPPPEPPRWTFFSRVFTFPWRAGAATGWLVFSSGLVALGLLGALIHGLFGGGAMFGMVAVGLFVLVAVWLSFLTWSYGATCYIAIVEETSDGNDAINEWPEPDWREWCWSLFHLLYVLLLAAAVGVGVEALMVARLEQAGPALAITMFLLFPFLLLSSMEVRSPLVPVSSLILRSLAGVWWAWIAFYVVSLPVVFAGVAVAGILAIGKFFWVVPLAAPMLAAIVFIHARLLGRLGWRIALWSRARMERAEEADTNPKRKRGISTQTPHEPEA
ncbi:MAG: hypothetical protein ACYC35_25065 [Pirellulales bacterium]